jgi:hypothetical protein
MCRFYCLFNNAGGLYNAKEQWIHLNRASRSYRHNRPAAVDPYACSEQSQGSCHGSGVQGQPEKLYYGGGNVLRRQRRQVPPGREMLFLTANSLSSRVWSRQQSFAASLVQWRRRLEEPSRIRRTDVHISYGCEGFHLPCVQAPGCSL